MSRYEKLTSTNIEETLLANGVGVSQVSKNRVGNFVARKSYFYSHGYSQHKMAEQILTVFPTAQIVNTWNNFVAFKG